MDFSHLKVLVVDDMSGMRKLVGSRLFEIGVSSIEYAEDGLEAWNILQKDDSFNLIVSDINMPNMTGIELLKKVRADSTYLNIYFIIITAEIEMKVMSEAVAAGTNDYIVKPFEVSQLKEKLLKLKRTSGERTTSLDQKTFLEEVTQAVGLWGEKQFGEALSKESRSIELSSGSQNYFSVCYISGNEIKGTLCLHFCEENYLNILSHVFGERLLLVEVDMVDMVSEFLNIISGRLKKSLHDNMGYDLSFSIPSTLEGEDLSISKTHLDLGSCYRFKTSIAEFSLYFIPGEELIIPWKQGSS